MAQPENWYRLDNAAKIYPAISNKRRGSVFRVSVTLRDMVDAEALQRAADVVVQRFPTMAVRLHKGLFWYYFENTQASPRVQRERPWLCQPMDHSGDEGFLFRISYHQRRVNVEMFHSLTDGTGALVFLKALVFHYLREQGHAVSSEGDVLDKDRPFSIEEVEDSFLTHYDPKNGQRAQEELAYQLRGTPDGDGRLRLTSVGMDSARAVQLSRDKGCTLGEYLTALLMQSIYLAQVAGRPNALPIRISVPVNLRRFFRSRTLRNFSSYLNIGAQMTPDTPFDDILEQVRRQMREGLTQQNLARGINANIQAERNLFLRATPLVIKNVALRMAYRLYGERVFTCAFSNLGQVTLPQSMQPYVTRIEVVLGLGDINRLNVAACSYGGRLVINFTRSITEPDVEKLFCRALAQQGLQVTVQSNEGGAL
ncbi:MAG: hypothetical protein PHO66_00725 [Eubacteriales bacterium]|nr:hypothetical protein [Eubacteriales bacterium]